MDKRKGMRWDRKRNEWHKEAEETEGKATIRERGRGVKGDG